MNCLFHMLPYPASADVEHRCGPNAERSGEIVPVARIPSGAGLVSAPNFTHLILSQLVRCDPGPKGKVASSLCDAITNVITLGDGSKMCGVTATRIIANQVGNDQTIGDGAVRQLPRKPMSKSPGPRSTVPASDAAVPVLVTLTKPRPARISAARLVNLLPERLALKWGQRKLVVHGVLQSLRAMPGPVSAGARPFNFPDYTPFFALGGCHAA